MKFPRLTPYLSVVISTAALAFISSNISAASDSPIVHLPATAIFATENNGRFAVITDTGRFIIQGTLYDVWNQQEINSVEEARWAATHIPLDKANVGFQDLEPYSVGQGEKVVYLFSDIQCGFCKDLIAEARRGLPEGYRLDIIMLPLLGAESHRRTADIHCASDRAQAWNAAVTGDMNTPLDATDCDLSVLDKRMTTAQFIGARNVPFLIRDDGLVQQGAPTEGLRAWINNR